MNDRQKKVLTDAFTALSAGAQKGKRLVAADASLTEIRRHVEEVETFMREIKESITLAAGAENVIDIATQARAKPLSSSRPR